MRPLNKNFHREDWKNLVSFFKLRSDNKVIFESSGSFSPFEYYADSSIQRMGALKKFPAENIDDLINLENVLHSIKDVYLVDYLVEISDPKRLVANKLSELQYKQSEIINFRGVGFVYHYIRK